MIVTYVKEVAIIGVLCQEIARRMLLGMYISSSSHLLSHQEEIHVICVLLPSFYFVPHPDENLFLSSYQRKSGDLNSVA